MSDKNRRIARTAISELDAGQREILAGYAKRLLALREKELPTQAKVIDAIDYTADKRVLGVLTRGSGRLIAKHAWKDRSWPGRIGLGAAGLLGLMAAGQGAALAVLGTAIGVPMWMVFGSGDRFAEILIDEIGLAGGEPLGTDRQIPIETEADVKGPGPFAADEANGEPESVDVDEIVEELDDEFSGRAEARRIDEALGIDPEIFDTVKERLEELKEEIRSGGSPGDLLQKWLLKRKQ